MGFGSQSCRDKFKPLALSVQYRDKRSARKANDVLKHVEFSNQISEKEFRSFYFQDPTTGEIFLNCANCVIAVSAKEIRTLDHSEEYLFTGQMRPLIVPDPSRRT